jgi:hypothetical protein
MKNTNGDDANYSLHNLDNFNDTLDSTVEFILENYINLVVSYLKFTIDALNIKNNYLFTFIISRGIDTITNVFSNMLYYTKNVELTHYHCQKSYYYYNEFIEQIMDEKNTFLQLTSRDATTYVYKKSIYEITNDIRKNIKIDKESNEKYKLIMNYNNIFKKVIYKFIEADSFWVSNNKQFEKLEKLLNKINKLQIVDKNLNIFISIMELLENKINDIDYFYEITCLFFKKITKNLDLMVDLKEKIYFILYEENIEFDSDMFISIFD